MTKGKYAAKAKNRLANLDNEILQEKLAEITGLQSTITGLEHTLDAERRDRGRLVIERADELSRSMIDDIRRRAQQEREEDYRAHREVVQELANHFSHRDNYPPLFFTKIIPRLLRPEDRNEFVDRQLTTRESPSTRESRRHGANNVRRHISEVANNNLRDELIKELTSAQLTGGGDDIET
ncbi:hypothetical protein [Rhodococcus jostii]|uniref:hypothetical protein n=1 Tax=Rhodococcus jostii TaxID=132919 RepID=UPI003624CDD8